MTDQQPTDQQAPPVSHRKLLVRCAVVVLCMLAFPFASIPLYNAFCTWTGINGKVDLSAPAAMSSRVRDHSDKERTITVEFVADASLDLPWTLKPEVTQVKVNLGESTRINFYAENTSSRNIVARAVPSVSPGEGGSHFKKTQCFCFDNIQLQAGEKLEMPVVFYLDESFPDDIATVTLAYKVFDVTDKVEVVTAPQAVTATQNL
jgi:cytochrome c oxidase assembly protein subunit 11